MLNSKSDRRNPFGDGAGEKIMGNYSGTQNHYQWTSLCRNYPGCVGYYTQTGNLTAECAEGRGGEINGYGLCVPLRPPRLFFLPEITESQSGDQSTYLSSYDYGNINRWEDSINERYGFESSKDVVRNMD